MNFIISTQTYSLSTIKALVFTAWLIFVMFPYSTIAESSTYEETISAGNRTYDRFCSVCHGQDGKGDGIYKENLKIMPSNLTKLASDNDGIFPWVTMYQIIDGNDVLPSHGTREMPIWGELFNISNWSKGDWNKGYTEHSIVITRGRIFELLVYLDFIQEK